MAGSKRRLIALVLVLVALLAGCWDRTEIEDMAYLVVLGIDRAEGDTLLVTAMVAVTPELAGGGVEAAVKPERPRLAARFLTARSETVTQALYILNGGLSRRLDSRQTRAVIVGEALAREGLEPLIMELTRAPWARGNIFFAQARGRAHDVLTSFDPVSEVNPPRMLEGLLLQAKALHLAPPLRLHHFVARRAAIGGDPYPPAMAVHPGVAAGTQEPRGTPAESALPGALPRGGGNPVDFVGTAIYRGDRLVGFLNVDQTQMLLALRGEMGKAYVTFPDPDDPERQVTMRFHQENLPAYRATMRDGRPYVTVSLHFEGEVLAVPGGTNYAAQPARARLEQAAAQYASATIREVLERLREWEADPIGFGHLYRGRFSSWSEWAAFDWSRRIGQLEVEVEAAMRIRRYGLVLGPDRIRQER